tara:strand:+ start:286 stop:933 length:648 start_codon:yes stop_codon:yes gene_type:complete
MKKIAVVLAGNGFKDGAEITEAVSTLIGLSQLGVDYKAFAPDLDVTSTDHISGDEGEKRNVLIESSRITRGQIEPLSALDPNDFDGVVFPGGFGAALHLCDFAKSGHKCTVLKEAESAIKSFYEQSKPIAAFCIAPALVARVLGEHAVEVTIGNDKETASEIEKTGAQHVECAVDDFVTDRMNKVITSPAYMYEEKPHLVFTGITKALKEFVEMA